MKRPRRAITPEERQARLDQMFRKHDELRADAAAFHTGPMARQATVDRQRRQADLEAQERERLADKELDDYVRTFGLGGV